MQFDAKMLDCGLNILPKDSQIIISFYSNFLLIDVPPNQEKTFTIRLNAKL